MWYGLTSPRFLAERGADLQRYFNELLAFIPNLDQCEPLYTFFCAPDVTSMTYEDMLSLEQANNLRCDEVAESPTVVPEAAIECLRLVLRRSHRDGTPHSEACAICMENMQSGKDLRILDCGHVYHFDCIATWMMQRNTCCVCQAVALRPDGNLCVQ